MSRQTRQQQSIGLNVGKRTLAFLAIVLILSGCGTKMSLKEARRVTLEMSGTSFVPPPRRMSDILNVIEQKRRSVDLISTERQTTADKIPPYEANDSTLADFYFRRGEAALSLGRYTQAVGDLRSALSFSQKTRIANEWLITRLGVAEFLAGNFKRGIELQELALRVKEFSSSYSNLVSFYARVGDIDSAVKVKNRGVVYCNQFRGRDWWNRWPDVHIARMEAFVLDAQGNFADAETYYRKTKTYVTPSMKTGWPMLSVINNIYLARNLKNQGRLLGAEVAAREALSEALEYEGSGSEIVAITIGEIGDIALRQGRLEEAEALMRAGLRILEEMRAPADSFLMGVNKMWLGDLLAAKCEYAEAVKEFDRIREGLQQNQYVYERVFARNPNLMLALLKTDRTTEAMELITLAYDSTKSRLGSKSQLTAQILGLRGIAHTQLQETRKALADFSEAVPILIEIKRRGGLDYTQEQCSKSIIESYVDLLSRIRETQLERDVGVNASDEAFRIADALHGQALVGAVGASSARAALVDQDLADLVRREQDTIRHLGVLQTSLADLLAAPGDQRLPEVEKHLKAQLEALTKARAALLDEIRRRFPKYSDLVHPKPASTKQVQDELRLGEALLFLYTTESSTYVWALPYRGKAAFTAVPIGKKEMGELASDLRKALDPHPQTVGDIPEFDLNLSYDLYRKLLKPVEGGWHGATDLLIVAGGSLGQLPFSVLTTAPVTLGGDADELFGKYREIPWLVRKVSMVYYPSASSFLTLRQLREGDPARKAFAGFGDPLFNPSQLAQVGATERALGEVSGTGGEVSVRGVRLSAQGDLDSAQINSSTLGALNRLRDTAEEIVSIAEALGADPGRDIFLGQKASEAQVKAMDLSDRRVVAFATHALVPGDLDGLDQPALALSAPEVTGEREDGLLTVGEILTLKLNADWVLLSGCNTAAAAGAGAEALSGLGRAFFYAGTRAVLVSMWSVETTSARKLTSELFRYQKKDPRLSRARALQKSMLQLIDGPGLRDGITGKIAASYAHPFFWAPFVIVGEGGSSL
jgi:CHAT domain-containing protein